MFHNEPDSWRESIAGWVGEESKDQRAGPIIAKRQEMKQKEEYTDRATLTDEIELTKSEYVSHRKQHNNAKDTDDEELNFDEIHARNPLKDEETGLEDVVWVKKPRKRRRQQGRRTSSILTQGNPNNGDESGDDGRSAGARTALFSDRTIGRSYKRGRSPTRSPDPASRAPPRKGSIDGGSSSHGSKAKLNKKAVEGLGTQTLSVREMLAKTAGLNFFSLRVRDGQRQCEGGLPEDD